MIIYYLFFILLWYALTVNFVEGIGMMWVWIILILITAFFVWLRELILE